MMLVNQLSYVYNSLIDIQITCGRVSGPSTISAKANAGSTVEFDWNGSAVWPAGDKGLGPLNHHGPVMTYLAKCDGPCKDAKPQDLDWFKFQDEGRISADEVPGVWGSDKLTENGSKIQMTLPSGLATGEYVSPPFLSPKKLSRSWLFADHAPRNPSSSKCHEQRPAILPNV